jgi:hypothetical protein
LSISACKCIKKEDVKIVVKFSWGFYIIAHFECAKV